MYRIITLVFLTISIAGCSEKKKVLTTEMGKMARETVEHYLIKNELPNENLVSYKSHATTTPDFAFLYTGGGRCIEFIINCYGNDCTELMKYPFDEHGDTCPNNSLNVE